MKHPHPLKIVLSSALSCLYDSVEKVDLSYADCLTEEQLERLIKICDVRMGKKHTMSAILAIAAARNSLLPHSFIANRLGVIASGGPIHLQMAFDMTRSILSEGPEYLDPLRFPHSIPSSVPTAVAAACNARAFAFGLGYDHEAFFEGIEHASRLIVSDFADSVVVVAANGTQECVHTAVRIARRRKSVNTGICALVTRMATVRPYLELLRVSRTSLETDEAVLSECCEADESAIANSIDACAATGAVLLYRIAMRELDNQRAGFGKDFRVAMRSAKCQFELMLRWVCDEL